MKTYRYHQNRARTTTANMPFSRNIKSKYVNKRRVKTSHKPRRHMNKSATPSKRVGSRYTKSSKNRDNFAFDWFQPYDENEEFKNNKNNAAGSSSNKTLTIELSKHEIFNLIETTSVNHVVEQNALKVDIGLHPEPLVFSQHLNDTLMEEETRRKKGKLYKHFSDKVDSMLKNAMKKYYKGALQAQERKWISLQRKQKSDWTKIKKMIEKKTNKKVIMDKLYNLEEIALKTARDEDDFEAQVLKMEKQERSRYFSNEKHNLKVALKNQLERLDSDWDDHISALEIEYETIRTKIYSTMEDNLKSKKNKLHDLYKQNNNSPSSAKGSPYKSKEKQDQLIHTAPVLRPTKRRSLIIETHKVKVNDTEKKKKLNQLNLRFQEALKDIKRQKQNAAAMIKRRNLQINLQLETEILIQDKIKRIMRKDKETSKLLKEHLRLDIGETPQTIRPHTYSHNHKNGEREEDNRFSPQTR